MLVVVRGGLSVSFLDGHDVCDDDDGRDDGDKRLQMWDAWCCDGTMCIVELLEGRSTLFGSHGLLDGIVVCIVMCFRLLIALVRGI